MANTKKPFTITALILLVLLGISAIFGGGALIIDPSGNLNGMPVSLLEHSPFSTFLIPGLILFLFNGVSSVVIAILVIRKYRYYSELVISQGIIQDVWIIVQLFMIKSIHFLHYIYFIVGALLIISGIILRQKNKTFRTMKTLYILIGLKGSGKTFVGKLIEDKFGILFLRVENIFKGIKLDRHYSDESYIKEGFTLLEKEIRNRFKETDMLTIESTGLTDEFKQMMDSLKKDFSVKLIKIAAEPDLCLKRVTKRDNKEHINISDSDVEKINELAMKVKLDYDLTIDNNLMTGEEIVKELKKLIGYPQSKANL